MKANRGFLKFLSGILDFFVISSEGRNKKEIRRTIGVKKREEHTYGFTYSSEALPQCLGCPFAG
jgi:hypothetical protein